MKQYLVTVECAIEHKAKFLVIKRPPGVHAGGLLAFPGGKVEEQDEINSFNILKSAAKREIFEEVGLVLEEELNYLTSSYFITATGVHIINTVFHCVVKKDRVTVIPSEREVPEYYWMNQEEINKAQNSPEWLKNYVQLIQRED